jgi:hypothetical protein
LGRPDLSHWQTAYAWKSYTRWKRVKKVAKATEILGWPDDEIQDYVSSGWESETFTLPHDRFCDLLLEIAKLKRDAER